MHVVRSSNHDCVDVFLLFEHLAVVGVALGLGNQIILKVKYFGQTLLHFVIDDFRGFAIGGRSVRMIDVPFEVGDVCIQARKTLVRVAPVHVTEGDDVLAGEIDQVAAAHAANANAGDVQQIAGRGKSST